MPKRAPTDVDAQIGARLRELRIKRGVSQSKLGAVIGITFQQIQKFELGNNRITASQLFHLAAHLGVSVSYFFPSVRNQTSSRRTPVSPDVEVREPVELLDTEEAAVVVEVGVGEVGNFGSRCSHGHSFQPRARRT